MPARSAFFALSAALAVSACGATMVNAPGHAGAYAPVNDADRVGVKRPPGGVGRFAFLGINLVQQKKLGLVSLA